MGGQPVWLASISRKSRTTGRTLPTSLWTRESILEAGELLQRVLGPTGDLSRQRLFRMNITLCLHRALTDEEVDALPRYFHQDPPVDLAGGPVETLWETVPGELTVKPCHTPTRQLLDPYNTLLWLPIDCGECPPCVAREELAAARRKVVGLE